MAWDLIDLRDPGLFGNEAAEDEPEHIFSSYVLRRPEAARFVNAGNRFCVTRAYKGEGKSALLRLTRLAVQSHPDHSLVVARTSGEIAPALTTSDWPSWTRAWKARIFTHIAREIGGQIGFAWRDDDMSLVEEAEEHGFRRKGLVNSILDRVKVTTPEIAGTKVPSIERRRSGGMTPSKTQHAVARWSKGRAPLWVVVDDVDQNFQNTELQKRRVASFFVACRELINKVPELRIRAAVRPNVWTTLKMEYEALSHVEQYMQDLSWSEDQMRQLLARRIEGYLKRVGRFDQIRNKLPTASEYRDMMLIDLAFEARMSWGGVTRPAHVVLNTLSKHRPRWIVELSQIAASHAVRSGHSRIGLDDVLPDYGDFGRRRIQDLIAEFRSQCPEVEEVISAFAREKEQLTTDELLEIITNKILARLTPRIVGVVGEPRPVDIAAFLFEVGFIFGRRDYHGGEYEHIGYAERPSLFRSRTDLDVGLS